MIFLIVGLSALLHIFEFSLVLDQILLSLLVSLPHACRDARVEPL